MPLLTFLGYADTYISFQRRISYSAIFTWKNKNRDHIMYIFLLAKRLKLNPLSANPTKWSNTIKQSDELFECV